MKRLLYYFPMIIFFFSILVCSSTFIYGQGKIVGHVKDAQTNEPLFGANIVLQSTNIGAATDIEGDYFILNVPVGKYSLQATMIGMTKVVKTNVVVSQDQITEVNFELEATTIEGEEVVVTAERNLLHREVSGSQIVIETDQLEKTAGTRTLQDFLNTQAGITDETYLEIRGGRPSETGTVINGLTFVNARVGKTEAFIPTSAVEQISLKAGGMSAKYGQFRSGLIGVTTKTGSKDGYHGSFSFSNNPPHKKRFGTSLFDPMNNFLRPHLDPSIAFIGVNRALNEGIISEYEAQQFPTYRTFAGFTSITPRQLPANWTASLKPGETITAVDIYLYDAWMHTVNPDFDKLNATIRELQNSDVLNDEEKGRLGSEVTDQSLMDLFKNHANKEARYGDFNFDGGFGGPIPFLSESLGDATFYISNTTNRSSYIEPMELDYDLRSSTLLTLKSNITSAISLKVTGLYSYHKGMNPARGADSEPATLSTANNLDVTGVTGVVYNGLDRGALMPVNNIPFYSSYGSNYGPIYYWYNTLLQPWIQENYLAGVELNHAISSSTYYTFTGSYQRTQDDINPGLSRMRDNTVLGYAGAIPLTEMPYGRRILGVGVSTDTVDGDWVYDHFYSVPLLSERFGSKGGVFYDNSLTQQLRLKFDFGSQVTKEHYILAGIEFNYTDLKNRRWAYWPYEGPRSMYEYNFNAYPRNLGAYVQDQIVFEDMVANIGIRMDYYSFGDLKWPTGNLWDANALGYPYWTPSDSANPDLYLELLQAGRSLFWDHLNEVNAQYIDEGKAPLLQPVTTHLVFSPRFGISFPITEDAKFYFNYGHFYSQPPLAEMLAYDFRYNTSKGGLSELGNPNLAPSRTIQYELGVDYFMFNHYLLHIAGYYKDVTGDVRAINLDAIDSDLNTYRYRINDRYRTIQGLEIQFSKNAGEYITGWLNFQLTYASDGATGKSTFSEDPATNNTSGFIYANPQRPYAIPEIRANITFSSPDRWGYLLGGWNLSLLPHWRAGNRFTYNPQSRDEGRQNYFYWPNYWNVDLKFSKSFDVGFLKATAYLNINNLFNNKQFLYQYAFYDDGYRGDPARFYPGDFTDYMASLHLNEYKSSYYDGTETIEPLRDETEDSYLYPGYVYQEDGTNPVTGISHKAGDVVTGEDKIGDMHSADKPWINSPNVDLFTYGYTRSVWFGIMFNF